MDKRKGGKQIGLILLIPLILAVAWLLVKLVFLTGVTAKDIIIAFTGFFGSIIGGAITLIGVRMTIERQDDDKFLESFLSKMTVIRNALNVLNDFRNEDCPEHEGEELWEIILRKSKQFAKVEADINSIVGGITAYQLLGKTFYLTIDSTIKYDEFLRTHYIVELRGRGLTLNEYLDKFISAVDEIIDALNDEETRLMEKYEKISKKRRHLH